MSFSELLVVLCVALVVIKPERLPEMAYLMGRTVAKLQGWFHQITQKYTHFF